MERHVAQFLNKLSFAFIAMATLTFLFLFLQTPQTCVPPNSPPKPHLKFPKSTCDSSPRELVSLHRKNARVWATKAWRDKLSSFAAFFLALRDLGLLPNHTRALCLSAGAGHQVMALSRIGLADVTGVELLDSPPLVSRADPHNLPFFDHAFDFAFTAHLAEALFPSRFVSEMERVVRPYGSCVVVVEESGDREVREIVALFVKSRFVDSVNVSLTGLKMTRIIMKRVSP